MAVAERYEQAYRRAAERLVEQMTLSEKVGQMVYTAPAIPRLGIPAYNWWNEALHGVARAGTATVFPQAIGLAATFDEALLHEVGAAVSTEARAKYNAAQRYGDCGIYKGLTLWAPNINIFRDPRWGRGHETFGEDPYLTSRLGMAYIQGLQGDDERYLKAAACAKHFAVHSGPENVRHNFDVSVPEPELSETYLHAFRECVETAHVEGVMGAYNSFNGRPCCGNEFLLTETLRNRWGFRGYVTSDCWAIVDFYRGYGVAKTPQEAAAQAVKSGCDVNCGCTYPHLEDAVREGLITEREIDAALIRLFTTRMRLGILGGAKTPYDALAYAEVDAPDKRALNLQAAKKSLVLLKNDGVLPLDKTKVRTIGVIGPNADSRGALVGNYEGTASRYETVLEGLQDYLRDTEIRIRYSVGCHLWLRKFDGSASENDRLSEVQAVCEESDVIVACFGLDACIEGEEGDQSNPYAGGDKQDLRLPGLQHDVIRTICQSGKPVVLVLLAGSALDLSWEHEHVQAIVQGWYPGARGGRAVAELLFGEYAPEGRLPVTFYRSTDDLPDFTDYRMQGKTYRYLQSEPLYPFGYGLSYTTFDVEATAASDAVTECGATLTVRVRNTGHYAATDTVQIYVRPDRSTVPHPQLKKIEKVSLRPGEEKTIHITLPLSAFALYDQTGARRVEKGGCSVFVGDCQPDARSRALTGKTPTEIRLQIETEQTV